MKKIVISVIIAAILWFFMFSPLTSHYFNFWYAMTFSAIILVIMSLLMAKGFTKQLSFSLKDILIGIASAILLWGIFYLGDFFSNLLFDFARPQVSNIYAMKSNSNLIYISLMLVFLIGPAEEIFWRGYIQHTLSNQYGSVTALIATTIIYALVHIWSFNFMLIMAALVCGLFWGILYLYNKKLTTLVISHAIWDVAVFVLFPIQ